MRQLQNDRPWGSRAGFTLVELMIVVGIIGLLAALAIPSFVRARENSQNSRFLADVRTAGDAFLIYAADHGNYPADVTPGVMPAGMEVYLAKMRWTEPTVLGGRWDWDYRQFGVTAGVSVWSPNAPSDQLLRMDKQVDDGDLLNGMYRSRDSGYMSVIEN